MDMQLKNYVAPELRALGKIESLTNEVDCTGFNNKMGDQVDDSNPDAMMSMTGDIGEKMCI